MSELLEFIEGIEKSHFRTNMDTGAASNALFIWNQVRKHAGLEPLTHDDLRQRHVDSSDSMSCVEEAREFDAWYDLKKDFENYSHAKHKYDTIVALGGRDFVYGELEKIRAKYHGTGVDSDSEF